MAAIVISSPASMPQAEVSSLAGKKIGQLLYLDYCGQCHNFFTDALVYPTCIRCGAHPQHHLLVKIIGKAKTAEGESNPFVPQGNVIP